LRHLHVAAEEAERHDAPARLAAKLTRALMGQARELLSELVSAGKLRRLKGSRYEVLCDVRSIPDSVLFLVVGFDHRAAKMVLEFPSSRCRRS
jgi:hypothetical protein